MPAPSASSACTERWEAGLPGTLMLAKSKECMLAGALRLAKEPLLSDSGESGTCILPQDLISTLQAQMSAALECTDECFCRSTKEQAMMQA